MRNLKYIRGLTEAYPDREFVQQPAALVQGIGTDLELAFWHLEWCPQVLETQVWTCKSPIDGELRHRMSPAAFAGENRSRYHHVVEKKQRINKEVAIA